MKCFKLLVFFVATVTVLPSYALPTETTEESLNNDTSILHRQERQSLANPKGAKKAMNAAYGAVTYLGQKLIGSK